MLALTRPHAVSLRRTGIPAIPAAPWGSHFCQFYGSKEDLAEVLVPYFAAGLADGELCMWITSPPLDVDEAWEALGRAVPDLAAHRARGDIEILPHTDWYLAGGAFEQDRVLAGWTRKLDAALERGYDGLRLSGNTFWLEKADWKGFAQYEEAIDGTIGRFRMLALCTYALERCGASEIADVIRNHQFALLKRDGAWETFESFDRRELQAAHARELAVEREQLSTTLQAMAEGVITIDEGGRIVTLNPAAEALTGLRAADAEGRPFAHLVRSAAPRRLDGAPVLLEEMPACRALRGERAARDRFIVGAPGAERVVESIASPLGAAGHPIGAVAVWHDVTDLVRSEEALRDRDRKKDDFLALLSHELRNPLAPIRNSLWILEHTPPGGEKAERARAVLERQVGHLTRLVDDLLDVTRISRGKMQLCRERLDLAEVVARTVEDHQALLEEAGIALEVHAGGGEVPIDGDRTRLAQAIGNLLGNAAKFTPRGGDCRVTLERDAAAGEAVIRVRDTGTGIAPDVLPRVFEPFVQADGSSHRAAGGLGLGLALVRGVAELHGGRAEAASEGPGRGAEFTVRLPLLA